MTGATTLVVGAGHCDLDRTLDTEFPPDADEHSQTVLTLIDRCRDSSGRSRRDDFGRILDTKVSPDADEHSQTELTLIDRFRDIGGRTQRDDFGRVLDTEVSPETNGHPQNCADFDRQVPRH